jgi:hypothetical protein
MMGAHAGYLGDRRPGKPLEKSGIDVQLARRSENDKANGGHGDEDEETHHRDRHELVGPTDLIQAYESPDANEGHNERGPHDEVAEVSKLAGRRRCIGLLQRNRTRFSDAGNGCHVAPQLEA